MPEDTAAAPLSLAATTTALVTIDLQKGILAYAQAPVDAASVLAKAVEISTAFRRAGAPVVRVKVGWSADFGDALKTPVDAPNPGHALPADWLADPDELPTEAADIRILKRQWGAFHGTDLDLQLRRRGIRTLVLGGIATSIGVESTARFAWELGYEVVIAEDLCSGPSAATHETSFQHIFPRLARIRSVAQVIAALA